MTFVRAEGGPGAVGAPAEGHAPDWIFSRPVFHRTWPSACAPSCRPPCGEDFVRFHLADQEVKGNSKRAIAAQELVEMLRTYLK